MDDAVVAADPAHLGEADFVPDGYEVLMHDAQAGIAGGARGLGTIPERKRADLGRPIWIGVAGERPMTRQQFDLLAHGAPPKRNSVRLSSMFLEPMRGLGRTGSLQVGYLLNYSSAKCRARQNMAEMNMRAVALPERIVRQSLVISGCMHDFVGLRLGVPERRLI
jgi:hypothetical protein